MKQLFLSAKVRSQYYNEIILFDLIVKTIPVLLTVVFLRR